MKKKILEVIHFEGKEYVFGTRRPRHWLDDALDQVALDNYYEAHKEEERTPEKDKEILRRSYLTPKE